ncbi:MAG: hypothetical protein LBJ60_01430, partial [Tannerellaceae bacterium]|nr:hypothetical protein [Tannerellaceae bacterium]
PQRAAGERGLAAESPTARPKGGGTRPKEGTFYARILERRPEGGEAWGASLLPPGAFKPGQGYAALSDKE